MTETEKLVAEFLARGGRVTQVAEGARPSNAKLARTGAERFFARNAVVHGRLREGETYHGK